MTIEIKMDCLNNKPIRLCLGNGMRVFLTLDQAWRLAGELTQAVIEVRKPLAGFAGEGLA